MKKVLVILLSVLLAMSIAHADNVTWVFPAKTTKLLIGEEIPAGCYYLIPISGVNAIPAKISYTVILDYGSKQSENDARDFVQQPELSYPEHADHFITLNDGDLLLLFAFNESGESCDVLLVPKGEDATGGFDGLTYEALIARKSQINLAIWKSEEWQEVKVLQGVWKVGEDIPAGHWTLKCAEGASYCTINWGEKLDSSGDGIAYSGRYSTYNKIYNPNRYTNSDNYSYQYSFKVQDGDYIIIEDGSVVFMPYVGKPTFEFK